METTRQISTRQTPRRHHNTLPVNARTYLAQAAPVGFDCKAEIDQNNIGIVVFIGEEQVLWFKVAVGDGLAVEESQRLQQDADEYSHLWYITVR